MTTRKEIIAHIEDEITRLERVRDLLEAALRDSRKGSKAVLPFNLKAAAALKKRKPAAATAEIKPARVAKAAKQAKPVAAAKAVPVSKTAPAAKGTLVSKAAKPARAAKKAQLQEPVAAAAPPVKEEPEVKRLPPRRRMERRHVQADKPGKSGAALSGAVPAGPVAVSANEARKVQERAAAPAPAVPEVSELRPENPGERSLGSLIQAFERRAGLSGLETS